MKPTIKNLQRGLVAIHHGADQSESAVKALRQLLQTAFPNDRGKTTLNNTVEYYFGDKYSNDWYAVAHTTLPSYPVSAFFDSSLAKLKAIKEDAEAAHAAAAAIKATADELYMKAATAHKLACDNYEQAISNQDKIVTLDELDKSTKKQVKATLERLGAADSVEDFCEKLTELQTILKQWQKSR